MYAINASNICFSHYIDSNIMNIYIKNFIGFLYVVFPLFPIMYANLTYSIYKTYKDLIS